MDTSRAPRELIEIEDYRIVAHALIWEGGYTMLLEAPADSRTGADRDSTARTASFFLLLKSDEAAALCRTSVRTWRNWDAAARIPAPLRIGRVKLWRPLELADWVAAGCPPRAIWEWDPRVSAM